MKSETVVGRAQSATRIRALGLAVALILLALFGTTPAVAAEGGATRADAQAFDSATAGRVEFDTMMARYLTARPGRTPTFDLARARDDGASPDVLDLGLTYNRYALYRDMPAAAWIKLPIYGNWCGPGHGGGDPIDVIDTACRKHDLCYARRGYFDCSCDRALIADINRGWDRMRRGEKIMASAVKAYFTAQMKVNRC